MKHHILTFIFLILATIAFALRFHVSDYWQNYCDILSYVFPTIATVIEIVMSERSSKKTEKQIKNLKDNQLSVHVEGETLYFDKGVDKDETVL